MHPVTLRVRGERLDSGDAKRSCAGVGDGRMRTAPSPDLRKSQAVFYASAFFRSDGESAAQRHAPRTHTVGTLRAKQTT